MTASAFGSQWRIVRAALALLAFPLMGSGGCGGGMDFGPSVRVPVEQRQVVEATSVGKTVNLPKDQPFNIHVKQSTQSPGADGTAQGKADAQASGEASCSAEGAGGGAATGEFHIGQAIDCRSDVPMKAAVRLSFDLTHELDAEPIATGTLAQLSLAACVRDSSGRVNPKIAMESLSSDDAPGKGARSDAREFSFVMEPGGSYQILLDGSVNATSDTHGKARAKLSLKDFQVTVTFSPAPVPTTAPAPAAK